MAAGGGDTSSGRSSADAARRAFLAQLAQEDAPEVIAEARSGARERVRAIIEDALVDELLRTVAAGGRGRSQDGAGTAWWAYCVVNAQQAGELAAGLRGVDPGSPVEVVDEGELAVLASRVPLTEYGDERLREHLEDIAWLERTARAHEAVQEAVLRREALVPLRLCTIFRDAERIRSALSDNAEVFSRNLAALAGVKEWGIKVFVDVSRLAVGSASGGETEPVGESGTAYLTSRQKERDRAAGANELCARCTEEVRRTALALSIDERVNPLQPPEAHGRDAEMILNGAYLVGDDRVAELREAVSDLRGRWEERGLFVELTGPWPAYNFVSESVGMFS